MAVDSHLWLCAYRHMSLLPAISATDSSVLVAFGDWREVNGADASGPRPMEPLVARAWPGTERPDCQPGPGSGALIRQAARVRPGRRPP
jgi:hypothetical protein